MEHIIKDGCYDKLSVFVSSSGVVMLRSSNYDAANESIIDSDEQLKLVKALLPDILERGELDDAINGWISANVLDGEPLDDCGKCTITHNPKELYELVYDCISDVIKSK